MLEYVPGALHLQWHITQRCNLRCTHCYQESYKNNDMPFNTLVDIVEQYKDAIDHLSAKAGRRIPGHITLTGGEPFVRKDFFELLNFFSINRYYFTFSILTNGTMIDEETAKKLGKYKPSYVQVSIEGTKETHESIRGVGSYDKTVQALKYLKNEHIPTLISFTAHKMNYKEFPDVARLAKDIGVNRVWSDRLIPFGNGKGMEDLMFTPEDTKEYFGIMRQAKETIEDKVTEVAMHRALQFLCGGQEYKCSAGKTLITIDSNGDVYPCRRMPVKVGNVTEKPLLEIYQDSEVLDNLRNGQSECKSCNLYDKCQGGLKCLSYAMTGNPLAKDPGCWIELVKSPVDAKPIISAAENTARQDDFDLFSSYGNTIY